MYVVIMLISPQQLSDSSLVFSDKNSKMGDFYGINIWLETLSYSDSPRPSVH